MVNFKFISTTQAIRIGLFLASRAVPHQNDDTVTPTSEFTGPAQGYISSARTCLLNAEFMISSPRLFNQAQCECVVNKLKEAVQNLQGYLARDQPTSPITLFRTKLLSKTAQEVESVVRGCDRDGWIQTMIMANMSEHVSELILDLESCMLLEPNSKLGDAVTQLVSCSVVEAASRDQGTLLTKLIDAIHTVNSNDENQSLLKRVATVIRGSTSNDQELQLAKCLSSRLLRYMTKSVQVLSDWEIQYKSSRLGEKWGVGSFGEVRKYSWLGVDVAEKSFIGSNHSSFIKEVKILAGLAHPNIVPLFGYATDKSACFIVMELMDGDLPSLMRAKLQMNATLVPFSNSEAIDLMLQIARGMRYLHEKRVVHRDLKAQNILVKCEKFPHGEYVYVKVADFGFSVTKSSSVTSSNQSLNVGTTRWMAPEMVDTRDDSEPKYPFKVDVYSFGMVCYEILTGEVPFSTTSKLKDVKKMVVKGDRPVLPPQCPDALEALICSCWEAEPKSRPSFVDICETLRCLKFTPL